MNKDKTLWIVLGLALAIGLAYYLISDNKKPNQFNWQRTLQQNGKEPYDLSIINKTIQSYWGNGFHTIPENSSLNDVFNEMAQNKKNNYFFIGNSYYLTQSEIANLEGFVKGGGNAFISASEIPALLLKQFKELEHFNISNLSSDSVKIKFNDTAMKKTIFSYSHYINNEPKEGTWNYLENDEIINPDLNESVTKDLQIITNINSQFPDFICLTHGSGKLFLHVNPQLFSNYYLKSDDGRQYVKQTISHLSTLDLWCDLSAGIIKTDSAPQITNRRIYDFIASEASLKYAWWILVCSVFAFLLFGGKRTQRAIPVIKKPQNNTLSFVESMGYFYFSQQNNLQVYQREWEQFLAFIRYNIHMQVNPEDIDITDKIATRCGIRTETIQHIFNMHHQFKNKSKINNKQLLETNKILNQFYTEYKNQHGK